MDCNGVQTVSMNVASGCFSCMHVCGHEDTQCPSPL